MMHVVASWVWLVCLLTCLSTGQGEQPDVIIHLCKIPLVGESWSLCCATKDIHSATVTFFHRSPQSSKFTDIAVVKHTCETNSTSSDYSVACVSKVRGQRDLILTILNPNLAQDIGIWGCRYYGKTSSLTIQETQVLFQDGGVVLANKSESVRLDFVIKDFGTEQNVTIYNPAGVKIADISSSGITEIYSTVTKTLSFDAQNGIVSLVLQNLTLSENGTYVCEVQSSLNRYGLTVIILEKLDKPTITPSNVTFDPTSKKVKSGTLRCDAVRRSAGPYYYTPQININWIYPHLDVGYNISANGSVLTVTGVGCTTNRSQPIFCEAQEVYGPMSDRTHFYPHSLCTWSPSTPVPPLVIQGGDKNDSDRSLLIAIGVIGSLGFALFGVMFCAGKKNVGRCCSFCCKKICWCCGRTICRKCTKLDDDEFYSDYISNVTRDGEDPYFTISRDRGSNWRDLLNVYSPGNDTPIPLPPALSPNTDENENEEGGPNAAVVAANDIVVTGAEGVDRSVLIKEVEHGLKELRKTLHNAQTQVQVSRENLVQNLFDIYTDPMIVDSYLHVKMVDEQGSDWGGVSRDCFTSFWNDVSENFFRGNSVLIPHLPPHRLEEEYKFRLLGRILAHSTAILGYIPVPLCKSVVMVTILDTTTIDESTLLEDFLLFLDQDDARIVRTALTDFGALSDEDRDNLQDMFSRFDMGCLIQESTFRDHFMKMARSELCIKPRSLCQLIREGIPEIHYDRFWSQLTIDHLQILNDRLKPTAEKIIACLRPDESELNSRTEKVYGYFTDLITDLAQDDLEMLLQFITGQACVPRRSITVNFSDLSGMERRPIAHTCSFSIELPDTYESYEEFQTEFRMFLKSDIIRFDIQ